MSFNIKKIDKNKAEQGVWYSFDSSEGIEFLIAQHNNQNFRKLQFTLLKPFADSLKRGKELPEDKLIEITRTLFVKTILLDWKGIKDGEGNDVPYSHEKALELVSTEGFEFLVDELSEFSMNQRKFFEDSTQESIDKAKKS